jgi:hypothetical protein
MGNLPRIVRTSLIKNDHSQIQKGPVRMEKGQYPHSGTGCGLLSPDPFPAGTSAPLSAPIANK